MENPSGDGALSGIRIVEAGLLVQGPQAAALLAQFGADVIKVELPGLGDQARWIPVSSTDFRSPYFYACNRGKRSVALDLRVAAGKEAFLRLVEQADVLMSNFMPGTMELWGLGYETLSVRFPRLIYATGSTFGPVGPDAERPGADLSAQAAGGLISGTGVDGGDPSPVAVTIADHIASQNLVAGVLAALFARERTGRGQRVDVSLLGSQIWAQASEYTAYFMSGQTGRRANFGNPMIPGIYGIFPTADGWIAIVGVVPALRDRFYTAIGRPELFADERFDTPLLSEEQKRVLFPMIASTFSTRTTTEWCAVLASIDVRHAPVRDYAEVGRDPQAWENGYVTTGPDGAGQEMTIVGTPIRFSDTPARAGGPAPELGQHTEEVLLEVGYAWDEIAALGS